MKLFAALRIVSKAGYWTVEDADTHCEHCGAPKPYRIVGEPAARAQAQGILDGLKRP